MLGRKLQISATAAYNWSNIGAFGEMIVSGDGRLISTYVNTDGRRGTRLSGNLVWNPTDAIRVSLIPRCAWNRYFWDKEDISNFEYGISFRVSAKLPHDLEIYTHGSYDNPDYGTMPNAQAVKMHNLFNMDIGLSKQLKKCRAYIRIDRPWLPYETAVREMEAYGYNILNSTRQPVVRIRAGVTWNFGDFTGRVKRNMREISATDNQK